MVYIVCAPRRKFLEVHCVCTLYITSSAKHVDPVDAMSPEAKHVHEMSPAAKSHMLMKMSPAAKHVDEMSPVAKHGDHEKKPWRGGGMRVLSAHDTYVKLCV